MGAGAGVDFSRGEEKHTLEAEQEVTATRQELSVLFRATSRLAPRLALDAVHGALVAALPEPPAPPARWQTVETALAALHLVGEGADDPAVKPGAEGPSPLGELVAFLLSRWSAGGRFESRGRGRGSGSRAQAGGVRVSGSVRAIPPRRVARSRAAARARVGGVPGREGHATPEPGGFASRVLPLLQIRQAAPRTDRAEARGGLGGAGGDHGARVRRRGGRRGRRGRRHRRRHRRRDGHRRRRRQTLCLRSFRVVAGRGRSPRGVAGAMVRGGVRALTSPDRSRAHRGRRRAGAARRRRHGQRHQGIHPARRHRDATPRR